MALKLRLKGNATKVLGKIRGIVQAPFDGVRGRLVQRGVVKVFERQFVHGGYFSPGGGVARWAPTRPFGTRPATKPTLGGAGSSLMAAARGGPGGTWTRTPKRVTLSVSLVYWPVHDEGARIRITPRSRGLVRGKFGVTFRADKTHITIPRRRLFDARAPQWGKVAAEVVVKAIEKETR